MERLDRNGLSEFGFGLASTSVGLDVAYVVPEVGAENRVTPDGRLGVYRTGDGGASWSSRPTGCPTRPGRPCWWRAWAGTTAASTGTQSGAVFALATSDGGSWVEEAASQLPQILSVEAATWQ